MRSPLAALLAWSLTTYAGGEDLPSSVGITLEPTKFGDVSSILKVDSTVGAFKFDRPVTHLALVLEARPKEPRTIHVARLTLELKKPVQEGRFCVQMADQGFLPLGNGAPHQMQLFMQIDCGGTLISSSQSFLKEKFNFSRSLARSGPGTLERKLSGHRVPVFWLMGNSDEGTYFNDDDLDKMVAKNKDAYVLIAYLEVAKEPPAPVAVQELAEPSPKAGPISPTAVTAVTPALTSPAFVGPPYPVPTKQEVRSAGGAIPSAGSKPATATSKPGSTKPAASKSSSKKKKKRS